jgi:hypothetical protein
LIKYIKKCLSIKGDIKSEYFENVTGKGNEGFLTSLSPEHLDRLKEIMEILGCKSESTVAVICIIYAANSTFGNLDKNKINKILKEVLKEVVEESDEAERLLTLEYCYKENGLLREIKENISLYENRLSEYIKKSYLHFKKLERYNERRNILMPCVSKIIQKIENEGWCNHD